MNKVVKIVIVVVLIVVVGVVIAIRQQEKNAVSKSAVGSDSTPKLTTDSQSQSSENPQLAKTPVNLPRLVDLGAGKCIPCKMMAPILEELKSQYQGKLTVDFIDVWEKPDQAKEYKINIIPTQIFYDLNGKELFRHEGFFSKEDILAKWRVYGINLEKEAISENE